MADAIAASRVDGADHCLVSKVETVKCRAIGTTIEILSIEIEVTDRTAASDVEAFDEVALEVILEEVI